MKKKKSLLFLLKKLKEHFICFKQVVLLFSITLFKKINFFFLLSSLTLCVSDVHFTSSSLTDHYSHTCIFSILSFNLQASLLNDLSSAFIIYLPLPMGYFYFIKILLLKPFLFHLQKTLEHFFQGRLNIGEFFQLLLV